MLFDSVIWSLVFSFFLSLIGLSLFYVKKKNLYIFNPLGVLFISVGLVVAFFSNPFFHNDITHLEMLVVKKLIKDGCAYGDEHNVTKLIEKYFEDGKVTEYEYTEIIKSENNCVYERDGWLIKEQIKSELLDLKKN